MTDIHQLIKADMDRGMVEMRRILDEALFTSQPISTPDPLTRRQYERRKWWLSTRAYFVTLWRALRGDELDTPREYDENY